MKIKLIITIISLLLLLCNSQAFDNENTHPVITETAAKKSNIEAYFSKNLGFIDGINTRFPTISETTIIYWLNKGSDEEDTFTSKCRSSNHFLNPLLSWDQAYLTDPAYLQTSLCSTWNPIHSAITWATGLRSENEPEFSTDQAYRPINWNTARDYYYTAVTSSTIVARETSFAATFKSLGHVLHLLQDMAVPPHVRNDFAGSHFSFIGINSWNPFKWDVSSWVANLFEYYVKKKPASISLPPVSPSFNNTKLPDFWDTTQYRTTNNPSSTVNGGLAEYTNANFVSENTIFNINDFPYPSKATSVQKVDYQIPDPFNSSSTITRTYYKKIADGETNKGEGYLLAGVDYLSHYRQFLAEPERANSEVAVFPPMDDYVHEDYAKLLLPRAVGYSAALLDYFFRGQINLEPAANFQYLIRNNSAEDMSGDFSLYYDEKNTGSRKLIINWPALTIPAHGASTPVSFAAPADAQTPGVYMLVFKGTMGAEKDAVAGRLIKPGWQEEWDSSLKGNHSWLFTGIDLPGQNPSTGSTVNSTADGKLVKENIRYAGNSQPRVNSTFIGDAFLNPLATLDKYCADSYLTNCFADDFGLEFPLPITRNTRVRVKVDEMSINVAIPDQNCGSTFGPGGYQGITMTLDNGTRFSFTVPGQQPFGISLNAYLEPGQEKEFNIFDMLTNAGVQFTEPINLVSINLSQQLWYLCSPSTEEHRQRMVVDYIRIEE